MEALPPPPPLPLNSKHHAKPKLVPMVRSGFERRGQPITLLTNHFKVNVGSVDGDFYQYSVALSYDDGSPVDGKGIGRKIIDKLQETYDTELAIKEFAYDGEQCLFTVGPLPQNKLEFTVILEDLSSNKAAVIEEGDRKRIRRPFQSKSFKVEISYASRIPMRAIANALRGQESENSQEALRVLDIILRQNAAKQGCFLVRQSFFHNLPQNFCDLGGVLGCRGFHSVLSDVLVTNNYGVDALLRAAGVSISSSFTEIEGRVLSAPKLKVGNGEDCFPRNGRWNYNHKKLVQPTETERWAIVNFSVRCDIKRIWTDLARCGQQKGIYIEDPCAIFGEDAQARRAPPLARVEQMMEQIKSKLTHLPRFLLCLLPERKTSTIYGPWKRKTIADLGIVTHCISPLRVNDRYLTNVILKMNAKVLRMEVLPPPPPLPLNSKHHAKLKLVPRARSNFESSLDDGDRKRIRRPFQSKSFRVECCVAKIPMRAIANALHIQELENYEESLTLGGSMHTIPYIALRGSVVGILIFKGLVIAMCDGKGRVDLKAEKEKKEEARKKIADCVPDMFSDDFEEEEEKRKEASKVEEDIEDVEEAYAEISSGHHKKSLPLGNHVFVSSAGASKSFYPVWKELHTAKNEKVDFYIEDAIMVCKNFFKKVAPEEFDAVVSLGGYEKEGMPLIVRFDKTLKNGKLVFYRTDERRERHLVTLGSGSEELAACFKLLERDDSDLDRNEIFISLTKGIVGCSLEDGAIGGFVSGVVLEFMKKPYMLTGHHVLWYLANYFEDFKSRLTSTLIYRCRGITYGRDFEKRVECLCRLFDEKICGGSPLESNVIGVDKQAEVTVGLMHFETAKNRELFLEFLAQNADSLVPNFEFKIPSKVLIQDIGRCFRYIPNTDQDHLL